MNSLLRVPPTFRVWPSTASVCREWSADTSDTRTATNGATLACRGLTPDFEPVNVSSVRAGSDPPGTDEEVDGGGFVGVVGAVEVVAGGVVAVCGGALGAVAGTLGGEVLAAVLSPPPPHPATAQAAATATAALDRARLTRLQDPDLRGD